MKVVEDYTTIETSASVEIITEDTKSYNKKSDYKDYDSLNLFNLKTTTPISGDNKVTNILDLIFAKSKDRDFSNTKKPHYRTLPKDLSDMEI